MSNSGNSRTGFDQLFEAVSKSRDPFVDDSWQLKRENKRLTDILIKLKDQIVETLEEDERSELKQTIFDLEERVVRQDGIIADLKKTKAGAQGIRKLLWEWYSDSVCSELSTSRRDNFESCDCLSCRTAQILKDSLGEDL